MEHKMHLDAIYFDEIKKGLKKIETRLLDEKRRRLSIGDVIEFSKRSEDIEKIKVEVKGIKIYDNWKDLVKETPLELFGCNYSFKDEMIERGSGYPENEESNHKNVVFYIGLKH